MSNSDATLQKIMALIDDHSEEIPEGDYLDMCNKLRDIFRDQHPRRTRTLPNTLRINPMDTIFQRCMVLVRRRKELKKDLHSTKPRSRITFRVTQEALDAYCSAMDLPLCNTLEELYALGHEPLDNFFEEYLQLTNEHRRRERERYIKQLDEIENEVTNICHFITATQSLMNAFYAVQVGVAGIND